MATDRNTGRGKEGDGRAPAHILERPVQVTRLANLKALIDERFEGNATACARAIGRTHTFLWQLLNQYRGIGEGTARLIEDKLGLAAGSMDKRAVVERSETLVAHLGGGLTCEYRMTPERDLDRMNKRPVQWLPYPDDGASVKAFFVKAKRDLDWAGKGDLVFCDPFKATLEDNKPFVVILPSFDKGKAALMTAERREGDRWIFISHGSGDDVKPMQRKEAQAYVVARVTSVVRHF